MSSVDASRDIRDDAVVDDNSIRDVVLMLVFAAVIVGGFWVLGKVTGLDFFIP